MLLLPGTNAETVSQARVTLNQTQVSPKQATVTLNLFQGPSSSTTRVRMDT
jgi:hypothetical protein